MLLVDEFLKDISGWLGAQAFSHTIFPGCQWPTEGVCSLVLVTNFYKASLLLPAYVLQTTYLHTYTSITIYRYKYWSINMNLMTLTTSNLDSPVLHYMIWCLTLQTCPMNFQLRISGAKLVLATYFHGEKKHETWLILLIFVPCDFEWGCWADSRLCSPGNLSWGEGAWSVVVSGWKIARVEALWKRRHSPLVSYSLYPMFFCFKEIRVTWWFDIWFWVWLKLAISPSRKEKWNEILPIFTLQCYVEPSGDLYWIKFV